AIRRRPPGWRRPLVTTSRVEHDTFSRFGTMSPARNYWSRQAMTRTFRMLNVFTLVAVMTASVSAAGQQPAATTAQTQGPAASVPAPIQAQATDRYEVGQARPPIVEGSKLRELTLDQAYAIALEKNLDLKSARMNPQLVDYQLQGARAAFLPTFNSDYSYRNSQSPSNNALEGVANLTNTTQGYNGRWNQTLPWYGTTFSAQFTNGQSATNASGTAADRGHQSRRLHREYEEQRADGLLVASLRDRAD